MTFAIESYVGALPLRFGMSPIEVVDVVGEPIRHSTNFRKELIYDYPTFNVGFGASGRVTHIGFSPGADVIFDGQPVFANQGFQSMLRRDGSPKEVVGFIVLLNLGVAFSGFHDGDESQRAVSVFEYGGFDSLRPRMRDFQSSIA